MMWVQWWPWAAGAVAALVLMGLVRSLIKANNRVIALDERCVASHADVDAHLKHRHNLVPSLVATVRGFAQHEEKILDKVMQANAEAMAAMGSSISLNAEKNLTASLQTLFSSGIKMPDIKAESHFIALRNELIDCENRVTAARRFHNIVVGEYNASSRQWPASMFARRHGMARREPFDLGEERQMIDRPVTVVL